MVMMGLCAYALARHYNLEFRYHLHGIVWTLVGVGSIIFHGTLTYFGQMLDELPMIYAASIWCYVLLEIWNINRSKIVSYMFILYCVFWTIFHASSTVLLQHYSKYYMQFLFFFGIVLTERALQKNTNGIYIYKGHILLRRLTRIHMGLILLAVTCWILDQQLCDKLHKLPFGLPNPQLHAWWHVLAAISIHFGHTIIISSRLAKRFHGNTKNCICRYIGYGIIPISNV